MAGDIVEVKIASKGTAGSRTYKAKAGESYKMILGGSENETRMNGDATGHPTSKKIPWSLKDVMLETAVLTDGIEFLQDAINDKALIMTVTFADGKTYKGSGWIIGSVEEDTFEGYAPVSFEGPGVLERIAG